MRPFVWAMTYLRLVRRFASAGLDPEAELERAYRRNVEECRAETDIHHIDGSVS